MRSFLRELWRWIAPGLFVVGMPFVVIFVGIGMAALGIWLPWDLLAQAGGIVVVIGVVWVGMMVFSTLFRD